MQAMREFEESFKTKLNAAMSEVHEACIGTCESSIFLNVFDGELEFHEFHELSTFLNFKLLSCDSFSNFRPRCIKESH